MKGLNEKTQDIKENVVAGIVGALLFSLVGGLLWFGLYMIGFMAGISGLVGAVCAIKGYAIFAKKESIKGVVISLITALIVMIVAWYLCLSYDVCEAYKAWYAAGEIDFTLTFFESARVAYQFLSEPEIASAYILDLVVGLVLCVVGAGSYVVAIVKKIKAQNAAPVLSTADNMPVEAVQQNADDVNTEAAENNENKENGETKSE